MNMCTFLAPDDVQLHDPVQLITTDTTQPLTIDALAQQSGTIDYTVLT
jgi:alanine racemase